MPKQLTVRQIKKGECIHILNKQGKPQKKIWIRQSYDQSTKTYTLQEYWDINNYRYVKGETLCIEADF